MFYSTASLPPAGLLNWHPQFPSGALRLPDAVTFPTAFIGEPHPWLLVGQDSYRRKAK
jgi:hypothetical protein